MDNSERKEFVQEVILAIRENQHCEYCLTSERRQEHREDHEFIKGLREIADRWENVRWELLRSVLQWVSYIVILSIVLGVVIMANRWAGGFIK